MDLKEELLKNMGITAQMGYALYFATPSKKIEVYQGYERVGFPKSINAMSNFRLASVTKQFIGYAIMKLIKEEKLTYQKTLDKIWDNLPEYMQRITIRELLNHTSGIYDLKEIPRASGQLMDDDVFEFLIHQKQGYFEHGKKYCYSNTGYILLELIIQKITGQKIEDYMRKSIFKPLGMSKTMINREGLTKIPNRVYGTKLEEDKLLECDQNFESATIGDGGIYSSVHDLKKWLSFLETKIKLYHNRSVVTTGQYYASGIRIHKIKNYNVYYHCGETIGTNTAIGFIPKKKIYFILLVNCKDIDTAIFVENIKQLCLGGII